MARPKKMEGRVAFFVPPGTMETVAKIAAMRTARQGGLDAREADIWREAVVRGLPLVLAAEEAVAAATKVGSDQPAKSKTVKKARR